MHIKLILDNELVKRASKLTGIDDISSLVHLALQELISRESALRLAHLGGSEPEIGAPPRRIRRA
jgi:hypothetical protein